MCISLFFLCHPMFSDFFCGIYRLLSSSPSWEDEDDFQRTVDGGNDMEARRVHDPASLIWLSPGRVQISIYGSVSRSTSR